MFTDAELSAIRQAVDDRLVYLAEYAPKDGIDPEDIAAGIATLEGVLDKLAHSAAYDGC